jgi:hypothetical protein
MKLFVAILVPFLLLMSTCVFHGTGINSQTKKDEITKNDHKVDFEKEVLPVLIKNCSPCHFTGGKMYERLPFDKAATLINNAEKILKRVGNDEKKAIVKEFILQNTIGQDVTDHAAARSLPD